MANVESSAEVSDRAGQISHRGNDFIDFLAWIWIKKLTIVLVTTLFVVLAIINALLAPVVFTAKVTMLPQNKSVQNDLLGQVQAFTGIAFDNDVSFEQLYGEILFSDRVLDKVIAHKWKHQDFQDEVSLFEIFGFEVDEPNVSFSAGSVAELKTIMRTSVMSFYRDDWTGYMTLNVTVPRDPVLAADLANFLARELDSFNRDFRGQRSAANATFIKARLEEVSGELKMASSSLTEFITANRSYRSSPSLIQIYGELEREVEAQTSVWIELRRQLELAKIEMNNEMVSVNVLDIASVPTKKSGPNRTFRVIVGFLIGLVVSFVLLLGVELFHQVRRKFRVGV